ncbi:DUF5320 family protein [Syntrophomonas wolfei]|jgi:hypothetical protein|uniref:DUF5320 family protein n=1 Tax=Syntrophomonas wolfei TaxID=863 RepID=UPI0007743468|nr:DUF5320 family protein [Syntrophomonas wolfei]
MPNRDGTGPLGRGTGTGRLGGKCSVGRGYNCPNPGRGRGRRNGSGNGPRGIGGGGIRELNTPEDTSGK